jgi:hypothetical protein
MFIVAKLFEIAMICQGSDRRLPLKGHNPAAIPESAPLMPTLMQFHNLRVGELAFGPELHATRLRLVNTIHLPLSPNLGLKLSDSAQHIE